MTEVVTRQPELARGAQRSSLLERPDLDLHAQGAGSFTRFVNSPALFLPLLLMAAFVAAGWYRTDAVQRAPAIAGYSWSQHPNALLLVYPSQDCGCGGSPLSRVREGLKHGLDVVVISPAPNKSFGELKRSALPASRFSLITDASPDVVKRFSPGDKPSAARIKDGRIAAQSAGGELSESFFKEVKR